MTRKEIVAYASLGFSKDLMMYFFSGMIMLFLTDAIRLSPILVGSILFTGRIFDAFFDIIVANFLENSRISLKNWFIAAFSLAFFLFLGIFSLKANLGTKLLIPLTCLLYFLLGSLFTIMDISYWSLLPILSDSDKSCNQLSSAATILTSFAALICFSSVLPLLHYLGSNNLNLGFSRLSLYLAVLVFIITGLTFPFLPESSAISSRNQKSFTLLENFKIIKRSRIFFKYVLYFFFFQLSFEWMNAYNIYYFIYSIKQEKFFSLYAFTILAQMLGSFTYSILRRSMTKKTIFILSSFLSIIGMLGLYSVGQTMPNNSFMMFLMASAKQFGSGLFLVSATAELANTIGIHNKESGYFNPALLTSAKLLVSKFANAIASFGLGYGLALAHYLPNQDQSLETTKAIALQAFFIPIAFILISYVFYLRYQKYSGEEENQAKILPLA